MQKRYLKNFISKLNEADELHLPLDYHNIMQLVVDEMQIGFGKIGQPLRISLVGKLSGAGLDVIMATIGKDETIKRVQRALNTID